MTAGEDDPARSRGRAPDLAALRLLLLVAEQGSLGRAAAATGISQPSASRRLVAAERRLGLVLLDRHTRGSSLTPAGRMVAVWGRRVIDEVDGLVDGAAALRAQRDAHLRAAASMTVAEHLAPGWITELRRKNPDLHVALRAVNSSTAISLVQAGEADIGFVESPAITADVAVHRVAVDRLAVVVAPDHRWARRRVPIPATELASTPLVVREKGSGTRETLDLALAQLGLAAVTPHLELDSTTAVRAVVRASTGVAVLSALAVATDLADRRLVEVPVDGLNLRRVLRAVWPSGRRLVGPAAAMLALATNDCLSPPGPGDAVKAGTG